MILSVPLSGYTVKGGVTYTVETARKEAFADVEYTLPKSIIEANKVDPNYKDNMKAKAKGKNEFRDRAITYFDDGEYAIVYKKNRYYEYYYLSNGELEGIGKRIGLKVPVKVYKYNIKGELLFIILDISQQESYLFEVSGKLDSYWIGDCCYDKNGNIVGRRH